ncbi:hypothetical protein TYRP_018023 [Tyrophagus putrescentiae]|nr:hypothetical protein TYRP_018023 [Tyrophagus putrescentiae]
MESPEKRVGRVLRKRANPAKKPEMPPEEVKPVTTIEPKKVPKDPAPYLRKYRLNPRPMRQLTLKSNGTLDYSEQKLASPPPAKPKNSIPKKKAAAKEPKGKAKAKAAAPVAADKPVSNVHVDMLEDVLKGISNYESEAEKLDNNAILNDLDELLSRGSEMTKNASKMLQPLELEGKEKPRSTGVKLSEDFALFEKWLSPKSSDVTDVTLLSSFSDPVRRLQVKYVRLLVNYIENVSPEAECEQFCLAEDLVSFAGKFEFNSSSSSAPHQHFSPDDLFPPFYFAVQRLIELYSNWEELPWLFDESSAGPAAFQDDDDDYDDDEDWDGMYTVVESQAARLRRRVEDVWDRLLTITLTLLQRSKLSSCKVLPFSCSTGTAFLLVVLVARNWYNLLFFNRLEPKPLESGPVAAASKCWNLVGDLGRTLCHLYRDEVVSPAEELIKLFYPFLLYSHQVGEEEDGEKKTKKKQKKNKYSQPLLLSYDEVDSLLGQLVAMTPALAFTWAHYHLVWEQLTRQQQALRMLSADDCARLLAPYQCLTTATTTGKVFTSWKTVLKMLLNAQSIPFTVSKEGGRRELFWYEARPALVHKLLLTLGTIAQKYLISECAAAASQSKAAEFKYLRSITSHFESFLSQSQFMSRSIIESINSLIGL